MSGAHQGNCNPTLDVSTRLRLGLPPLGGQVTGYPFQGSRCLHPQQPIHQGYKEVEVSTLLEASHQVHLLLSPFGLVEALLRRLAYIRQGISVHDTHVVNTVCPLLPEVLDKKVAFLFRDIWRLHF